jgi:hypothetical protein
VVVRGQNIGNRKRDLPPRKVAHGLCLSSDGGEDGDAQRKHAHCRADHSSAARGRCRSARRRRVPSCARHNRHQSHEDEALAYYLLSHPRKNGIGAHLYATWLANSVRMSFQDDMGRPPNKRKNKLARLGIRTAQRGDVVDEYGVLPPLTPEEVKRTIVGGCEVFEAALAKVAAGIHFAITREILGEDAPLRVVSPNNRCWSGLPSEEDFFEPWTKTGRNRSRSWSEVVSGHAYVFQGRHVACKPRRFALRMWFYQAARIWVTSEG